MFAQKKEIPFVTWLDDKSPAEIRTSILNDTLTTAYEILNLTRLARKFVGDGVVPADDERLQRFMAACSGMPDRGVSVVTLARVAAIALALIPDERLEEALGIDRLATATTAAMLGEATEFDPDPPAETGDDDDLADVDGDDQGIK